MNDENLFSATGEDFSLKMISYIRENFGHILGADVNLLDHPNGLDLISQKYGIGSARWKSSF